MPGAPLAKVHDAVGQNPESFSGPEFLILCPAGCRACRATGARDHGDLSRASARLVPIEVRRFAAAASRCASENRVAIVCDSRSFARSAKTKALPQAILRPGQRNPGRPFPLRGPDRSPVVAFALYALQENDLRVGGVSHRAR